MKIAKTFNKVALVSMLASLVTPLAILVPKVSAAAVTWDGEGADNNWSTAANWSGDAVPVDGDSLIFDVSILSQNETLNNDLTDLSVVGVTRSGDAGVSDQFSYTVEGNPIILSGPIVGAGDDEWGQLRMEIGITLGSNVTITNMSQVYLDPPSTFDIGVYDLTFQGEATIFGLIGSGDVSIESGNVSISSISDSTYSGAVTVTGGKLTTSSSGLATASSITVNSSGVLSISGSEFGVPLVLGGTGGPCWGPDNCVLETTFQSPDLTGGVELTSDVTFQLDGGTMNIDEPFTDNDFEIALGTGSTGSLKLPGEEAKESETETITIGKDDKSSASLTVYNNQTVIVNGERGSAYVYNGGTLKGTGTITGNVSITGGTLAPGESPGCLTISSGGLTFSGGTYEVEIQGSTVCSDYDQVEVTGAVDLSNDPTLDVNFLNSFVPELNDAFMIIDNDASDEISGTFDGLEDGATFTVDGVTFQINYNGGDGNDVMLLVTAVSEEPEAPDTGLESLVSNPLVTVIAALSAISVLGGIRFVDSKRK